MQLQIERVPSPIRWALVPLIAIVVALLTSIFVNVAGITMNFLFGPSPLLTENVFGYMIGPGLGCFTSVVAAAKVAPSRKNGTAFVIGCCWIVISGAFTYLSVLTAQWPALLVTVSIVVGSWISVTSDEYY